MTTCETCRFWNRVRGDKGTCRRSPPVIAVHDVGWLVPVYQSTRVWPEMSQDEWCGEHKPKDPAQ